MRFITAHRLVSGRDMGLLRCGLVEHPKRIQRTVTAQYALNYIHQGIGVFQREGDSKEYPIKPGTVIRRWPNLENTVDWKTAQVFGFVALPAQVFDVFRLSGVFRSDRPVFHIQPDERLADQFSDLAMTLRENNGNDFSDVLLSMISLMLDLHKYEEAPGAEALNPLVAQAMAILAADLDKRLSIPQLAKDLNVGYSKFRKLFRSCVGMSPGDYRIQRRMEKSLNMLMDGQSGVGEIADKLGYPDIYSFSLQFKKNLGMSPRHWRDSMTR